MSLLTGIVTVAMAALTLYSARTRLSRHCRCGARHSSRGKFAPIAPGRFRTFGSSDVVVYAENVAADGTLLNVFIERDRGGKVEVALAPRAKHNVDANGMTHTITLYDGERFEGVPGSPRFLRLQGRARS